MRRASDIATSDSLTALYTTAEAAALLLREATDSELLGARCAVTEAAYYLSDTIEPDDRGRLLVAATRQLEPPSQRDPAGAALSLVSDASGEVERLAEAADEHLRHRRDRLSATETERRHAMTPQVSEVMVTEVATVDPHTSLCEAARMMRDKDIGDVVVADGMQPRGILTDRDIAIRGIAESRNPESTEVGELASAHLQTLSPGDSVEDAVALMREAAVRRIPVLDEGSLVGIVSLGDLACELDRESALGEISAAPANH